MILLIFLNDNLAKIVGVALAWLAFAILRPGSDARKSRRHIRALRRDFVDQLSRHPTLSESEFESLTYHHVSQLSNSQGCAGSPLVITLGCSAAELFSCCLAIARLGIAFRSVIASTG
ncbi:putative efflux pump protein [Escherichia coli]|uniref:Putative efflux pump protein n=1 Tax=Escherichia coli TaxID=562 RepID=A0A2X1KEY8_ECOLX|nr:putative efflux pump protein [Escherichia coli]